MKKIIVSLMSAMLVLLVLPLVAAETAKADAGQQSYDFKDFTGIDASSAVQITLKQDKNFSIRASGSAESLDSLNIRVRGKVLHIGFRPHFGIGWNSPVQVEITMPDINRIRLSGAASLNLHFDARHSPRLVLDLSGAALLQGVLIASQLSGDVSGGSILRIEGYAESAIIGVNFAVDNATFLLSGGAFASMAAQTSILVKASGGAHLDYRGNPDVRKQLSGGASVSQVK